MKKKIFFGKTSIILFIIAIILAVSLLGVLITDLILAIISSTEGNGFKVPEILTIITIVIGVIFTLYIIIYANYIVYQIKKIKSQSDKRKSQEILQSKAKKELASNKNHQKDNLSRIKIISKPVPRKVVASFHHFAQRKTEIILSIAFLLIGTMIVILTYNDLVWLIVAMSILAFIAVVVLVLFLFVLPNIFFNRLNQIYPHEGIMVSNDYVDEINLKDSSIINRFYFGKCAYKIKDEYLFIKNRIDKGTIFLLIENNYESQEKIKYIIKMINERYANNEK